MAGEPLLPTDVPTGWEAAARDLFARADGERGWVFVGERPAPDVGAEQWWHAAHAWTSGRSFLKSIWRIDVEHDFGEPEDGLAGPGHGATGWAAGGAGGWQVCRRWALRRLQRKQPVVCRHADSEPLRSPDMLEWAMHEVAQQAGGAHRLVFGVVLPPTLTDMSGYYPYHYPRAWMYSFTFTPTEATGETGGTLSFHALPFSFAPFGGGLAGDDGAGTGGIAPREIPAEHLNKGVLKVLTMCWKWAKKHRPVTAVATATPEETWQAARISDAPKRCALCSCSCCRRMR
jgi:hypothetical protein